MNSAGCSGAADMPRSDVLHRSSSAPVCFRGKPAAVLRLLGMAKPPLPSYLQIAGSTQIVDAAIFPTEHDTGDQAQSVDVLMVDAATTCDKRTPSHSSEALRHSCDDKYDECRPHALSLQTEPLLPAVAAATLGPSTGIWQEAADIGCPSTPAAMAGVSSNTMGYDGGRLDGTIGDAVVAVGILTPGQHSPHEHYHRQQEQRQFQEPQLYQHQSKYLLEPLLQPLRRPPSPFTRSAFTSSLDRSPQIECTRAQRKDLPPLAAREQLTACEPVLAPLQQAAGFIAPILPPRPQEVLSALQPSQRQHHHHRRQQEQSTPQQPHRKARKSSSSTSSDSERESSDSELEQHDAAATRRRSSNGTPVTPPPPLRRRALSACSAFLDVSVAAAADVPQAPAGDETAPVLAAVLKAGRCCQSPVPCARCWPALGDTPLRDNDAQPKSGFLAVETAGISLRLGSGPGMAHGSVLTGPTVVASSQLGFVYRARGQRSVGLTRKRLLA